MEKRSVLLEDNYTLRKGHAFITGIQDLVRLPLVQQLLYLKSRIKLSWLYQRFSWFTFRRL